MRKFLVLAGLFGFLAPIVAQAQSLEWIAEHQGSASSAVAQTIQANPQTTSAPSAPSVAQHTNDGLEVRVRTYFSDIPVMAAIAGCESRFRQFSASGKALDGGAGGMIGLFQINARVHARYAKSLGMDIYTVDGNFAYARKLYQEDGTDPWLDSFSCWHKEMQSQVAASGNVTLAHDLVLGKVGPEVKALQVLLNTHGYAIAPDGPGSPGQETEKFGALTRSAVRKFQCEKMQLCAGDEGSTGYGLVGGGTRDALLLLAGGAPLAASAKAQESAAADQSAQIEALRKQIADLTTQLAALAQKQS